MRPEMSKVNNIVIWWHLELKSNVRFFTSNRRYVDPEGKSPDATFKWVSSFALPIGSLVICMRIQTNGLDEPRGYHVRLCLCSHPDSVDDWLLAIAQLVNENESQKNSSEKAVDSTSIRFIIHDLSSRFAKTDNLIIFTPLEFQLTFGNGSRWSFKLWKVETNEKQVAVSFFNETVWHSDNS